MAVQEQTPYQEITANGVTTSFVLDFDCENKDHLIVTLDGLEPPVGNWSLTSGAVVFTVAPASGVLVVIQRNTPSKRTTDYQSYNNSFRPDSVNKDFDWIWWKLQELGVADWILGNRIDALKAYVDEQDDQLRTYLLEEIRKQGVALDQLEDYYNYLMQRLAQIAVDKGWDASFVVDVSGENQQVLNNKNRVVESIVELAAIDYLSDNMQVRVNSYNAWQYIGGGTFVYALASTEPANSVTVIMPDSGVGRWIRIVENNTITAFDCGMKGSGLDTESDAASQRFINFLLNNTKYTVYDTCGVMLQENGKGVAQPVKYVAHRGYAGTNLENTISAFSEAVRQGCDAVEMDVQTTSDRKFIIYHDNNWNSQTDGVGETKDLTLAQIQAFKYTRASGTKLADEVPPTIEDVFTWAKKNDVHLNIEFQKFIHFNDDSASFAQIVKDYGMEDRITIFSYTSGLYRFRQLLPKTRLAYVASGALDVGRQFPIIAGNAYLAWSYTSLLADLIRTKECQHMGVELSAWIVPTSYDVRRLNDIGIKSIISDAKFKGITQ